MNTLMVITSQSGITAAWQEREQYVREFCEELENSLDDFRVLFTTYQDLDFIILNNKVDIFDDRNKISLKEVDLVHFKNWTFETEEAAAIATFLKSNAIGFFNSEVDSGLATNKLGQMVNLALANLPVPDTFFAYRNRLEELFKNNKLPAGFKYPLILKDNSGSKGDLNFYVRSGEEALKKLFKAGNDKQFVVQNFVPNDGDYRVLFIGLENQPLVFLRKALKGSHLNNTSKGGSGELVDARQLPTQYLTNALDAAKLMRREVCGVDIIVDKSHGKHYILEINTTPALATGFALDEKLNKFSRFVKDQIEALEEE